MLTEAITRAGMTDADAASFSTFDVEDPATGAKAPLAEHGPAAVHIAFAQLPAANDEPFPRFVAVVGREMEEDVILNTLYSR
jgi:hypothetical protein